MTSQHMVRFWKVVGADLCRYGHGISFWTFVKQYVLSPGFKYSFWMRLASHLRKKSWIWRPCYYFCRIILYRNSIKYGISIPYNTHVGPGLYIGHYGCIVVNDSVVIGKDCNINHGVTIGLKYGGKSPGVPAIGDRVYLGPGCKVIGGISIGNDVAIGANSVVVDSVPDFGVAAGVPAKVISAKGSSSYVVNTHDEFVDRSR